MAAGTKLRERWTRVQDAVFAENYYTGKYLATLTEFNMTIASIDQHEHRPKDIVKAANAFLNRLPNIPEIRRGPFVELCTISKVDA
jgi:hypothetical protein